MCGFPRPLPFPDQWDVTVTNDVGVNVLNWPAGGTEVAVTNWPDADPNVAIQRRLTEQMLDALQHPPAPAPVSVPDTLAVSVTNWPAAPVAPQPTTTVVVAQDAYTRRLQEQMTASLETIAAGPARDWGRK
jgi:hypothetical protein